jgi:hypothetical protein
LVLRLEEWDQQRESLGRSGTQSSLKRIERLLRALLVVQTLFFAEEFLEFLIKHFG